MEIDRERRDLSDNGGERRLRTHPRHPSPVSTLSELRDRCIMDIDLPLVLEVSSPVPSDKLDGDRAAAVAVGEDEPSGGEIRHKAWNKAFWQPAKSAEATGDATAAAPATTPAPSGSGEGDAAQASAAAAAVAAAPSIHRQGLAAPRAVDAHQHTYSAILHPIRVEIAQTAVCPERKRVIHRWRVPECPPR